MSNAKLQRTREQWEKCDPEVMSKAAVFYALRDAKRDVVAMHDAIAELREAARVFHNLTRGDSTVIIRAPSAEKRDAIVAAGERLRAEITSVI